MKFSSSQLAYLVGDREARGNLRALLKCILTLLGLSLNQSRPVNVTVLDAHHLLSTARVDSLALSLAFAFLSYRRANAWCGLTAPTGAGSVAHSVAIMTT